MGLRIDGCVHYPGWGSICANELNCNLGLPSLPYASFLCFGIDFRDVQCRVAGGRLDGQLIHIEIATTGVS